MPRGIVPNKAELAISAFHKLDPDNKGYVTRDDIAQLPDFASAFAQADQNRDGRLNASEFNSAWAIYTGNNP
jgi:Ca2+-binding EF-hand superfamily protein